MDTAIKLGTRKGRPNYSTDFKRRLAVAACEPNVSVSKLAMEHEINANMLFKWRRQYRAGLFEADAGPVFLPAEVKAREKDEAGLVAVEASPPKICDGTIEITIGGAVVRVRGDVDANVLRTVIQGLRA